jgi:hypothetical protein
LNAAAPGLPTGPLDLLAKAALAPPDVARPAWSEWRRGYSLDETPWNEVRMLGAIAPRLKWLEADAGIAPRILGIRKFLYAKTQTCLLAGMDGLRALASARIPLVLLKGVARIARDPAAAQERLVRDIDVLVPFDQKGRAFAVLRDAGWRFSASGQWQSSWHAMDDAASHHAWALAKGNGEIDLHHFSNYLNRLIGDDDGLWRRATPIDWRGISVLLPAATDNLIVCTAHGLRSSTESTADWAIDACATIAGAAIDWDLLVAEVRRRQLDAIMLVGLRYIKEVLQKPVPAAVLHDLAATARAEQWRELAYYAAAPMPRNDEDNFAALAMATARCLGNGPKRASGDPAGRKFALRLPVEALPLTVQLDVGQFHGATGLLELELDLDVHCELPPGTGITADWGIMGLFLDRTAGTVSGTRPGGCHCRLNLRAHSRLLARRGVGKLVVTVAPDVSVSGVRD